VWEEKEHPELFNTRHYAVKEEKEHPVAVQ
jgi:hypothetical protein